LITGSASDLLQHVLRDWRLHWLGSFSQYFAPFEGIAILASRGREDFDATFLKRFNGSFL